MLPYLDFVLTAMKIFNNRKLESELCKNIAFYDENMHFRPWMHFSINFLTFS